jgi:hypothetical protein
MLALDDAALAHIVIGATRVRASERGRWLHRLADKLDPAPLPSSRKQRWRQRQRNGHAIYRLDLNTTDVITALIAAGRLTEAEAERHELVESAIAALAVD